MFLYEKKIIYLSRYQEGEKESGIGFARITGKNNEWCIDLQVKGKCCRQESEYALYFLVGNEKIFVEKLSVQAGGILYRRDFQTNGEKILFQGKEYGGKDFSGIEIKEHNGAYIAGYLKEQKTDNVEIVNVAEKKIFEITQEKLNVQERNSDKKEKQEETGPKIAEEAASVFASDLGQGTQEIQSFDNKWDQLLNDYPQIHPFGDERVFISIEPKDFIVLRASYQKLVNNSFLLHGFYNYRYLILGPDKEIGESNQECFYLGVPGTYFEREKMVAVMFGFEGFECAGPVEIGKFGFYMRRVEL